MLVFRHILPLTSYLYHLITTFSWPIKPLLWIRCSNIRLLFRLECSWVTRSRMRFSLSKFWHFKARIYHSKMISYVPEDSFHIKEKKIIKKSTGFIRKSKGKIKPSVAHLCLFKFQYLHSFVYVAGRLC